MRGAPALVAAATVVVTLAGGGTAAAALPAGGGTPRSGPQAGVISTLAGGAGGPAKATAVAVQALSVSFAAGHLYIAGGYSVRRVSPGSDRLTTPAGTGFRGPLGDGGPATRASLLTFGVTLDHSGNLVIADEGSNRLRVVAHTTGTFYGQAMTAGNIYTVAGNGTFGFSGDGGPATSAELGGPNAVAVDTAGNLLIDDDDNGRIRMVAARTGTFYGIAMTAGDIYTVAGGGTALGDGGPATSAELLNPGGVVLDAVGNLLIADSFHDRIRVVAHKTGTFYGQSMTAGHIYTIAGTGTSGYSGDGGPATGAELAVPEGVATDAAGNVLIADTNNDRVRVVADSNGSFYGQPMTAGDIYTVAGTGTVGYSGDGGPATGAELDNPYGVAVDTAGNLLIADRFNYRVRVVAVRTGTAYGQPVTSGDIYTVAGNGTPADSGDGGPAPKAEFNGVHGMALDQNGNLIIADAFNHRVRVVAAATGTFYGQHMTAGDIYTVAGGGASVGNGVPATSAKLAAPQGVAVDGAGNLVIADAGGQQIRVVAASTGSFYGRHMTAGDIYTVAGNGKRGFSGDDGPATGAELAEPGDVAVDAAGNLLLADTANSRIRVVAAATGTFYGRAMTAGDIYTVAGTGTVGFSGDGGPATAAELWFPQGVAVDAAGNVLIADSGNSRIRVVAASTATFYGQAMTAGDIYTVAGGGTGGLGDGGPATSAELASPTAVAVDAAGNLLISALNHRVRVVAARSGTFFGQAMTAGDIYTVAGTGTNGFSGDGGPGTGAELGTPNGVLADAAGNLLIADGGSNRIREVTG